MIRLIIIALSVYSLEIQAQQTDWPPAVDICEVLRDPFKFNGQIIAVRGLFHATAEGWWLAGENCRNTLETKGYKWPQHVWLTSPEQIASMPAWLRQSQRTAWGLGEVPFAHPDEPAFTQLFAKIKAVLSDPPYPEPGDRITVTFLGQLETYNKLDLLVRRTSSGGISAVGFGHLGLSPAQLILKSVSLKDLIIEPAGHPRPQQ